MTPRADYLIEATLQASKPKGLGIGVPNRLIVGRTFPGTLAGTAAEHLVRAGVAMIPYLRAGADIAGDVAGEVTAHEVDKRVERRRQRKKQQQIPPAPEAEDSAPDDEGE